MQHIKLSGVKSKYVYDKRCQICGYDKMCLKREFNCVENNIKNFLKNPKEYKYQYLLKYKNLMVSFEKLNCKISKNESKQCLSIITEEAQLKRKVQTVFFKASVKIPFTAISLYEHDIVKPFHFPIENYFSKISDGILHLSIRSSLVYRGFNSLKKYDYWDVFRGNGDKRKMEMVRTILNTPISEIRKWKGTSKNRHIFRNPPLDDLPSDRPLHNYENLKKYDD